MSPVIRQYQHTSLFYLLATFLPWSFWGIAAYVSHTPGIPHSASWASLLAFAGLLAPVLIAFALMRRNRQLWQDLWNRMINLRGGRPIYWLLTMALMPASILLAQLISVGFGYPLSQFAFSENFSFTSGVFPVWFLLMAAPLIEELAWHSYGTDCLVNRFNLFKASLLFALFWGIWHMPLSFINDYYHSNLVETGSLYGINFLLSIFPFVIIMNWLYFKTGRSILSAIIFHITAGYFNEVFATHPDSKVIQTSLLLVIAATIVLKERELFFSPMNKRPQNTVFPVPVRQ